MIGIGGIDISRSIRTSLPTDPPLRGVWRPCKVLGVGATPCSDLKVISERLNWILLRTGSQCNSWSDMFECLRIVSRVAVI